MHWLPSISIKIIAFHLRNNNLTSFIVTNEPKETRLSRNKFSSDPTKGRFCRKQTFYDQYIAGTPFIRNSKISDLRTSFGLLASTVSVWAVFTVRRQFLGYITGDSTEYITNDSTQYSDPPQYYFLPYCDCNLKVLLPSSEWRGCTF